jgi:hypothetical protein
MRKLAVRCNDCTSNIIAVTMVETRLARPPIVLCLRCSDSHEMHRFAFPNIFFFFDYPLHKVFRLPLPAIQTRKIEYTAPSTVPEFVFCNSTLVFRIVVGVIVIPSVDLVEYACRAELNPLDFGSSTALVTSMVQRD